MMNITNKRDNHICFLTGCDENIITFREQNMLQIIDVSIECPDQAKITL